MTLRWELVLSPFTNEEIQRLNDCPKTTQPVSGEPGFKPSIPASICVLND